MPLSFAHPWLLLLVVLAPLGAWWLRHQAPATLTLPGATELSNMPRGRAPRAQRIGVGLRILGMTALLLALAGPRVPDNQLRLPTEGIALAFVVDVSRSMGEPDFEWQGTKVTRLEGVKRVFRLLVLGGEEAGVNFPGRGQDLMTLVVFAAMPETRCPLTHDHESLVKLLEQETPRDDPGVGTTNPGDALGLALAELDKAPTKRRAIVFLTDGESNVPNTWTPRQAAQAAASLDIPIYALDASHEKDPKNARKVKESLEAVASLSGGGYYRANDRGSLRDALAAIDRIERERLESLERRPHRELYPWFAWTALACWLLVLFLEATCWRRTP
jgi:Ca-activated chloride channel family protein